MTDKVNSATPTASVSKSTDRNLRKIVALVAVTLLAVVVGVVILVSVGCALQVRTTDVLLVSNFSDV